MEDLQPATTQDFEGIYSLLRESFPVDEYRPYEAQKALLSRPEYTAYILPGEGRINALITLWTFDEFVFIEHFAVASDYRNQGLGARILQQILSLQDLPVCLEAEMPETQIAVRRQAFYCRNGFSVNEFPYLQPAYAPDQNPVPLQILTTGGAITEDRFRSIRHCLYNNVYNTN